MVWACFYVVGWSAEFDVRDFEWLAGGLFVGVFPCGYCYGFSFCLVLDVLMWWVCNLLWVV